MGCAAIDQLLHYAREDVDSERLGSSKQFVLLLDLIGSTEFADQLSPLIAKRYDYAPSWGLNRLKSIGCRHKGL